MGRERWHLVTLGCEKTLERGRRPSLGAKVCSWCSGKSLLDGLCKRSLGLWGLWCDDDSFFICLQLGRQLRLGPFLDSCGIGLALQNKLFPAIPCTTVITYGSRSVAGLNRVSVHLSSCSFAAGLSLAR